MKKLTLGCGFRWQDDYNSAWAPASGTQMEENCVKESSFIKILGLCKGIEHISSQGRSKNTKEYAIERMRKKTCNIF